MPTARSTVIPCLRYHDAPVAIDWLCRVFGFERHLVVPGPNDTIAHAQLVLGGGMVMLGSATNQGPYGEKMRLPEQVGGAQTQTSHLVVADPDAVYARAQAANARIAIEIADADYGGRGFSCYDLEGHLWSIGSYDPWA